MEHIDSKYRLVIVAAKRAKQLNRGRRGAGSGAQREADLSGAGGGGHRQAGLRSGEPGGRGDARAGARSEADLVPQPQRRGGGAGRGGGRGRGALRGRRGSGGGPDGRRCGRRPAHERVRGRGPGRARRPGSDRVRGNRRVGSAAQVTL
ncbi:MAG: DNA-directed RNA polymerase subunit omega [Ignavibacteriales bacterium]|nr:DNA-directed RNA polymerase subunit omega [Ignavibacteriales bacterium]